MEAQSEKTPDSLTLLPEKKKKREPKRFVKSQIPDSVLADAALNAAIAALPPNYNFEVHKIVWRVRSTKAQRVALQFPEGLLMFAFALADIVTEHGGAEDCFVLGDVTFGACCVDDLTADALAVDLLVHFGHSCLVPVTASAVPCLYVFVDISVDVSRLVRTVELSLAVPCNLALAGTIQFASAIRAAKPELESLGFTVVIPQSKPLSAGEVLGCTAPRVPIGDLDDTVAVFVADGRFHLEAMMIANPGIKFFRYDPYLGKMFLEEYDQRGMRDSRRLAISKTKEAKNWGLIFGTLGRQGNPRILERLQRKMEERGFEYIIVMMSEISPVTIARYEDTVDAWIQIACPRLSIDWGEAFVKPVLTSFEAEIALGCIPGWWEKKDEERRACSSCECPQTKAEEAVGGAYPMDYYAQDGGDWNSSYAKKPARPVPRRGNVTNT